MIAVGYRRSCRECPDVKRRATEYAAALSLGGASTAVSHSLAVAAPSAGAALVHPAEGPDDVFEPSPEDEERYWVDAETLEDLILSAPGSHMEFEDTTTARGLGLADICDNVVKRNGVALCCRWIPTGVRGRGNVVVTVVARTTLRTALPPPPLLFLFLQFLLVLLLFPR